MAYDPYPYNPYVPGKSKAPKARKPVVQKRPAYNPAQVRPWDYLQKNKANAPAPEDPNLAAARTIANSMVDPQIAAINRAAAAAEASRKGQAEAYKGVGEWLAQFTEGMPAAGQAAYQTAADAQNRYATGLTGELGTAAQGAASQAAAQIANLGAPGGAVTSEMPAAANTVQYLGGALPAGGLAAQAASTVAELQGMRTAAGASLAHDALAKMSASSAEIAELRAKGLDIEATRPGEVQKALLTLREDKRQERALNAQLGQLQLARAKSLMDEAQARTNLTGTLYVVKNGKIVNTHKTAEGSDAWVQAQEQINQNERNQASIAGSNKRNAATIAAANKRNAADNKRARDIATQKINAAAEAKLKNGGFTNAEVIKFRSTAGDVVQNAWSGIAVPKINDKGEPAYDKEGNPLTFKKMTSAGEAFKYMVSHGIPFSLAYKAILMYAKPPGSKWHGALAWFGPQYGGTRGTTPTGARPGGPQP